MKLLIVDDHPIVVSGVKALLDSDADIEIMEANSAEAAERVVAQTPPDVAIVDVNLPGSSGFALSRWLLERNAAAKVIMFSMNDDPVFVAQAIEIGAKGYISKNDDPARMIDAIRAVANGGTTWPDGATERIAYLGGGLKPRTAVDRGGETTTVPVSTREHEILRHLAKGRSLSEIADLVGVSYKTIAQSCVQMRSRFGARTQMELVRIAVERKLV